MSPIYIKNKGNLSSFLAKRSLFCAFFQIKAKFGFFTEKYLNNLGYSIWCEEFE